MKLNFVGKKILSLFTAAALVAPLNATAFKTFAENNLLQGSGTSSDPYLIYTKSDLIKFQDIASDNEDSNAKLMMDIDFQSANGDEKWSPIGEHLTSKYRGTFDGNGHKISHLYNESSSTNEIGFIGYLNGGTVKNLTLKDCTFIGDKYVGAFVGKSLENSKIINCHNENTYVQASDKVGGIVGAAYENEINSCTSTGTVENYSTSISTEMGGIVGYSETLNISDCYNSGNLNTKSGMDGVYAFSGIVGVCEKNSNIKRCGFSGNLFTHKSFERTSHSAYPSGILGINASIRLTGKKSQNLNITDCYNLGNMYYNNVCNNKSMGLIGHFDVVDDDKFIIQNCFSNSNLIINFSGTENTLDFLNCYYKQFSENDKYYKSKVRNPRTLVQITNTQIKSGEIAYNLRKNSPTGSKWGQKLGTDTYPSIGAPQVYYGYENCKSETKIYSNSKLADERKYAHKYNDKGVCTVCGESITNAGDGTMEHPVPISSKEDLETFAKAINTSTDNKNLCAYLTQDIDLNPGTTFKNDGTFSGNVPKKTTVIGNNINNRFSGIIDGRGHTISGLYIYGNDSSGLVGFGNGCTVQNITLKNSCIKGKNYAGSIVGYDTNPKSLNNITISQDCYIYSEKNAGGIIGSTNNNSSTEIANCTNNGTITSDYIAGGIIGQGTVSNLNRCINEGNISAENYCGGIIGKVYSDSDRIITSITNCANNGNIRGSNAGGFIGSVNMPTNIKNSYCGKCTVKGTTNSSATLGLLTSKYGSSFSFILPSVTVENFCNYNSIETVPLKFRNNVIIKNTEQLSENQFASGQAAYILNGNKSDENSVWGQKIGTDKVPVFDSQTVYFVKYCTGEENYTNNPDDSNHKSGNNGICEICGKYVDGMSALCGNNLVVDGKIGFNFYMKVNPEYMKINTFMKFSILEQDRKTGEEKVIRTENADFTNKKFVTYNKENYHMYTCYLSPKELNCTIKAQLICGDKQGTEFKVNIQEYAYTLLNDGYKVNKMTNIQKEIVIAILNYASAAQQALDFNTDNLANSFLPESLKDLSYISEKDLKDFAAKTQKNQGYTGSVNYYGSSLVLDNEIAIKHYFTADNDVDISKITCTDELGNEYKAEKYGNGFVIKIDGFSLSKLGEESVLTINDGNTNAMKITYSPLSYAYTILKKYPDENNSLTNVARTMYQLYEKVEDYYFYSRI